MARIGVLTLAFLLIGITPVLRAESISPGEKQKIEALLKYVGEMKDTKFLRNGSTYDPKTAATFLRRKWAANASAVKTAREFIDKIATVSGTSGKPYLIRFKDGSEAKTGDVLLAALQKFETSTTE